MSGIEPLIDGIAELNLNPIILFFVQFNNSDCNCKSMPTGHQFIIVICLFILEEGRWLFKGGGNEKEVEGFGENMRV